MLVDFDQEYGKQYVEYLRQLASTMTPVSCTVGTYYDHPHDDILHLKVARHTNL